MALGEDGEALDFKIECKNNSIHVLNALSSAATACLAIGDEVLAVVKKILDYLSNNVEIIWL